MENRNTDGEFSIQFQNSDQFLVHYTGSYEFLPQPFRIASNVTLNLGGARRGINVGTDGNAPNVLRLPFRLALQTSA